MSIRIVAFDPKTASDALWAAFHVARREVSAELWPDAPVLDDAEVMREAREGFPLVETRRLLAMDGDEAAGWSRAVFRRQGTADYQDYAAYLWAFGAVRSRWRRQGIGSLLLRDVGRLLHELDKGIVTMSSDNALGQAFVERAGGAQKHCSVLQKAPFDGIDWRKLREWEDGAASHGLTWERHVGRAPRDVLLSLLPSFTALAADIPQGALDTAPIRWEIEGYDRWYETIERVGGAHHLVLLRAPDGTVAGLSEAGYDARTPTQAGQNLTAVDRAWRGHGLARALKAALMRQMREAHPEVTEIHTSNAEVNAPILSINARLGFKVTYRHVDYQMTRDEIDAWTRR